MKRLIPLAALAIAPAFAFADILGDPANFDGLMDGATLFDVGEGEGKIEGVAANFGITLTVSEADGDHDSSSLVAYTDPASQTLATDATDATQQQNYVKLSTGNDQLTKRLGGSEDGFAGLAANDDHDLYIDTLMQFTARASAPDIRGDTEAKFALYLDIEGKLHVLAGPVANGAPTDYATTLSVPEDDWVRLTVSVEKAAPARETLAFQVRIDGVLAATSDGVSSFPSLITGGADALTVKEVSFIGEGALDDFAVASLYPFEDSLKHWFEKGYGTENEPYSVPASASGLAALSDAVDALPAASTTDVHFSLAGDIDMTGADPFPGIGTYNAGADGTSYFSGVFDGGDHKISNITFTDRDYAGLFNQVVGGTIKNLKMENVSFVGVGNKDGEFGGAFFVGNARPGSTLENLVAEGTLGSEEKPLNHNAAGIVVRSNSNPKNPVNITACTNNAAIYGSYTKVAGILALAQEKNDTAGENGLVISACANNGQITRTSSANNVEGVAGIVGHATDFVTISDCVSAGAVSAVKTTVAKEDEDGNVVSETETEATDYVGSIVGYAHNREVAAFGVTTTLVDKRSVGGFRTGHGTATGLTYATISEVDGVQTATFIDDFDFTGSAKLMANDGATEYTPENGATLNFSLDTSIFGTGITLNVPEEVTVDVASASSIGGVTALKGEGRIVSSTSARTLKTLVQQSTWEGALEVKNSNFTELGAIALNEFGNANSTVCLNYAFLALTKPAADNTVKALEVGANGAYLTGGYSDGTFHLPCALTGSGTLNIQITDSASGTTRKELLFEGDSSAFAGSLVMDASANCSVTFGSSSIATGTRQINVASGKTVTVASGKTWSSADFIFNGNVTLDGALVNIADNSTGKVWNNYSTAVLTVNAANAFAFGDAGTWNGTYNVNYTQANNAAFVIPRSANAKTVINGVDGAFGGYPTTGSAAPTVCGEVVLNADWTIANGWTDQTTTFAKMSGSGNLTVNGTTGGTTGIPYTITLLDNYTGTLGGSRGSYTVNTVNVAEQPADDTVVVKVSLGTDKTIGGDLKLTVNGDEVGRLEYKSDATPTGLYLAASTPDAVIVNPGEAATTTYDTEEAATTAAAAVTIGVPEAVAAKLTTEEAQAAYTALFEAVAVEQADGSWKIEVALKSEVKAAIQEAIDSSDTMAELGAALKSAAVSDEGGTAEIAATPGLYYVVDAGSQVTDLAPAVCELAESEKITLTLPKQDASGFYQLHVEITPVETTPAEDGE